MRPCRHPGHRRRGEVPEACRPVGLCGRKRLPGPSRAGGPAVPAPAPHRELSRGSVTEVAKRNRTSEPAAAWMPPPSHLRHEPPAVTPARAIFFPPDPAPLGAGKHRAARPSHRHRDSRPQGRGGPGPGRAPPGVFAAAETPFAEAANTADSPAPVLPGPRADTRQPHGTPAQRRQQRVALAGEFSPSLQRLGHFSQNPSGRCPRTRPTSHRLQPPAPGAKPPWPPHRSPARSHGATAGPEAPGPPQPSTRARGQVCRASGGVGPRVCGASVGQAARHVPVPSLTRRRHRPGVPRDPRPTRTTDLMGRRPPGDPRAPPGTPGLSSPHPQDVTPPPGTAPNAPPPQHSPLPHAPPRAAQPPPLPGPTLSLHSPPPPPAPPAPAVPAAQPPRTPRLHAFAAQPPPPYTPQTCPPPALRPTDPAAQTPTLPAPQPPAPRCGSAERHRHRVPAAAGTHRAPRCPPGRAGRA